MNNLLQRIAYYFAYQYKGNDKTAPKMELSVDDLRSIAALNVEKCKLKTYLRNLLQVKTNADKIRNMSDEELAQFLCKVKSDYQWMEHEFPSEEEHGEWEEWLRSEAE